MPAGEFPSTWRFALQEGLILQTTLSLVWREKSEIHLSFIGDGGAVIEQVGDEGRKSEVVGIMDEGTRRVHALGPRNRQSREPDVFRQIDVDGPTRVAVFTDGIGRGLGSNLRLIFDEAEEFGSEEVADDSSAQFVMRVPRS